MLRFITVIVCIICTINCCAQIFPAEGAKLNYTQVMFQYAKVHGAAIYRLQVAEDTPDKGFVHCVVNQKDSATASLVNNLEFGKKYEWRYAGINSNEQPVWQGPYHFEIIKDSFLSKNTVQLIVTKKDTGLNAGGLIVNDCTHTITDRSGKMVWYLPGVNYFFTKNEFTKRVNEVNTVVKTVTIKPEILDLRVNPYGTVTYLADSIAADYDLTGNLLWKAPNDGKVSGMGSEGYNHDFKRLPNGHYMVLGNELWSKIPAADLDTTVRRKRYADRAFINGIEYAKVEFGTVMEYDKQGNLVWSWNSHRYFEYDPIRPKIRNQHIEYMLKPHINAFSIDKKGEYVYLGFRDASRIIKIEKSTGNVVDSWGYRVTAGGANHPIPIHKQHDANVLDNGNIAVFNSNDYPGSDSISSVVIISQQPADSGKIIWQFDCGFDSVDRHADRNGGNVDELKNGNYLVCMGNSDRIFEVTKDKQVVWQADIKTKPLGGYNYSHRLYRAHYISSLYPCYFTFYTDEDTIGKSKPAFNIRIFNKGSESDAYQVRISLASGATIQQFTTDTVLAGHSITLPVKPGNHLHKSSKIEISVTSQTNADFVRKSEVVVE